MYTIQENVRIVLSLLKQYNVRYIVVSPGGTNIPFSQAVQDDPFFTCYSVADERSAMYFAIGLYLQTGEIIATSCTSAQATRNYVPGLTEAFYKHVPILAITTSKLERYQYQDYMQAPDQCSLPKDAVRKTYDLPPVTDDNTRVQVIQSAREAILEVTHRTPAPIQINVRIDDKQQNQFIETKLTPVRELKRYMAWDDWNDCILVGKKILIVVGEHRQFSKIQQEELDEFCNYYNVVVYVNNLSNYNGKYAIKANLLMSCGGLASIKPDLIVTLGGQTGDYSLFYSLFNKNIEHWRVSKDGDIIDTYNSLTKVFECPEEYFLRRLKKNVPVEHTYYDDFVKLNSKIDYGVEVPFSNLYIAQTFYSKMPHNSIINFAILNSLRCWNYFPLDKSISGYGNVAAFGIDGCNSMLIGESMNTNELCFLITGDLAFFYDMNSLGIRHIKNNIRIILINNSGGAEFKIMTSSWKEKINTDTYISANGHYGNAKGWAENCGFKYLSSSSKEEFLNIHDQLLQEDKSPILLEVFTKQEDETEAIKIFLDTNTKRLATGNTLSKIVKKIESKIIHN